MIGRIWAIMRKEFIHILRDRRSLGIMFFMPIMQLVLLGYAATTDIEHLATAVFDADRTARSRALITAYQASDYFLVTRYVDSQNELARLLDNGDVRAGVIIPAGYARDIEKTGQAQISFALDGSDPSVASVAFAASQSIGQAHSTAIIQERMNIDTGNLPGVEVRPRVWYNAEMRSVYFMIPGTLGMILQFLATMFTALAIVREREQGTIEQLIVTPIRSIELVIGKVAPYVVISFFNLLEVLVIGIFWFGVPLRGSLTLLLGLSSLFLLTSLGIGLFISAATETQQEAMYMTMFTILPSVYLSGFFFPIEAMPLPLRAMSYAVPLRYQLIINRSIMLKGVGLEVVGDEVGVLLIFCTVILILAATRFRKRLE